MKANGITEEMVGVLSMKLGRECSRKFHAWICIVEKHSTSWSERRVQHEMFYLFVSLRSEG